MNLQPTIDDLAALARKYNALVALRETRDRQVLTGAPSPEQPAFLQRRLRALSEEFPGCLRELDTLGLHELRRRAQAATLAADDGTVASTEPWMPWIAAYHRLMRATLKLKQQLAGAKPAPPSAEQADALAREASRATGIDVDARFVAAVAAPPQGRLGIVVLRLLAQRFAVDPVNLATTLFPPRRPRPYAL